MRKKGGHIIRIAGALLAALLLLLSASTVSAAVAGFVVEGKNGRYYQYDYDTLLDSYVSHLTGSKAPVYKHYRKKPVRAFLDSKRGYIDYDDVLDAYVSAIVKNKSFNCDKYTASKKAKKAAMPEAVYIVTRDGSKNKVKYTKQTLGKGVLQKLNKAGTAAALKKVVNAHAKEIGLDLAAFKKLGSAEQNAALKEVLSKKPKKGFASLAKFRSTFDSAVTGALTPARKKALQAINGASTGAKMKQALLKHDAVLGLNLDRYKLSGSRQNTLASRLVKLRPFKSRKELRRILQTTVVSIRSGFKIEYKRYNYTLKTMLEKQMKVKPQTDLYGGGWKNAKRDDVQSQLDPLNIIKISYNQSFPADHLFQFLLLSGSAGTTAADLNKILKNKGTLHKTGSSFLKAGQNNKINEIFLVSLALHESGNGKSALARGYDVLDKDKLYPGGGHQYSREARVTADKLNVRDRPTTEGKKLAQVKKSDVFTILGEKKGEKGTKEGTEGPWYKIKAKGVEGWISGRRVKVSVFVKVYNMFGIGAVDSSPTKKGAERAYRERWFTPAKAILGGAKFASVSYVNHPSYHQDTLYKMRWNPGSPATHQYATDIGWASKQVSRIRGYYDLVDKYTLTFEIPRYK